MNIFRTLVLCIGLFSGFDSDSSTDSNHCDYSMSLGFFIFNTFIFFGCLIGGMIPLLFTPAHKLEGPSLSLPPFRHNCPIMFALMGSLMGSLMGLASCIGVIIKSFTTPVDWHSVTIMFAASLGLLCSFLIGKRIISRKIAFV